MAHARSLARNSTAPNVRGLALSLSEEARVGGAQFGCRITIRGGEKAAIFLPQCRDVQADKPGK